MTEYSPVDVIVDLAQDTPGRAALLLETLLALDEGMPCRYRFRLDWEPLHASVQALLPDFLLRKNAVLERVTLELPFPQEALDADPEEHEGQRFEPNASSTKQAWFRRNLSLLQAVEGSDEFVYLLPESAPLKANWLAMLVEAGRKSGKPVLACPRRLRVAGGYLMCGWSSLGWFKGVELRALPLRKFFTRRMENPWAALGRFDAQSQGPGVCLVGRWLSGYDVPFDYLLFALYGSEIVGGGPTAWAEALDPGEEQLVVRDTRDDWRPPHLNLPAEEGLLLHEYGHRHLRRDRLREHYRHAAGLTDAVSGQRKQRLSGPRHSPIGGNRMRLEIGDLRQLFAGERCFLIGNGPSLNRTDLSLLRDEYTIGLNRIYLNRERMGFQTSFLCAVNPNVVEQFAVEIDQQDSIKFLRYKCRDVIHNRWNCFFMQSRGAHDFHPDLRGMTWCEGSTVTYCGLQLAFYLGFEQVILVGVDHDFPDSGKPHRLVTSEGCDLNHFHKDYFGQGVKWQYPDLAASEVSYRVAKAAFEQAGRQVLDATVNGKLRVFQRVDYRQLFA